MATKAICRILEKIFINTKILQMKFSNKLKTSLICFIIMGATAFAQVTEPSQTTVTDDELNKIAAIFQELQPINMEGQQKMAATLETNGFEVQRFNDMYKASQSPNEAFEATEEEKQKFDIVMSDIQKIQADLEKKMEVVITKQGLSVERYQQVATAFQTDTELQKRLETVIAKQQPQQPQEQ